MGLVERAGPGLEEYADRAAEAACELTDAVAGSGWSAATADDSPRRACLLDSGRVLRGLSESQPSQ
ncbi:hypothetical protein ACFQ67_21100 [Streptomyces sp. NPDC056488]|uniref:hypothetical protein n=1 Tax=Streptomyces sp. NPDC056488 TaxID=3345836 RepID=UPI003680746E